jgi:hypothetical protein
MTQQAATVASFFIIQRRVVALQSEIYRLDARGSSDQAEIDRLTAEVNDLHQRLENSQGAMDGSMMNLVDMAASNQTMMDGIMKGVNDGFDAFNSNRRVRPGSVTVPI